MLPSPASKRGRGKRGRLDLHRRYNPPPPEPTHQTTTPLMPQPVIEVAGLVKHYGKVVAVDGIDFSVPAGATVALLGGNGAGKTTTLSILLGLLLPTAGRIRVLGEDMLHHRYRVLPG